MLAFKNSWDPTTRCASFETDVPSALAFRRSDMRCGKRGLSLPVVRRSLIFFLVALVYVFPGLPDYCGTSPIACSSSSCA